MNHKVWDLFALTIPNPPVGSTRTVSQSKHLTAVDGLLKTICSFLQSGLGQINFKNLLVGSLLFILSLSYAEFF